MMKWKCGAAAAVLAALLAGSAGADFIKTDDTTLAVPMDVNKSIHADFKEGKKTVRFAAGCTYDGTQVVVEVLTNKKEAWKAVSDLRPRQLYHAFVIEQYRDTDTGRYFYGVESWDSMESTNHAYLVGFDAEKKNFIRYIDSDSFMTAGKAEPGFILDGADLILYTKKWRETPLGYQINWSEESQWFGYEYRPDWEWPSPKRTKSRREASCR